MKCLVCGNTTYTAKKDFYSCDKCGVVFEDPFKFTSEVTENIEDLTKQIVELERAVTGLTIVLDFVEDDLDINTDELEDESDNIDESIE